MPNIPTASVLAIVTLVSLVSAGAASAAEDHLACFKVKGPKVFDAATVDLASALPGYDFTGCFVKSKASQLCVPVSKTVASLTNGNPVALVGDDAVWQRVCYKVKCPGAMPGDAEVTDQFGTQVLTPVKIATICTPAVAGACVDLDEDTYGSGCTGGDDCDDADPDVNPGMAEVCNGKDDDCDGAVDDSPSGAGAACSTPSPGVCTAGTTTCSSGALVCVSNTSPSAETCDFLDNDCDGIVDDSPSGAGAACSTPSPGVCTAGTTTCSSGALVCVSNTSPSTETCDLLDNDCDGLVDESVPGMGGACTTVFPGVCAAGTTSCTSGSVICVSTTSPSSETCDNLDNDCDGATDEGLARSCYTGPGGTAGVGACRSGTQTCSAGSWGATCPGEVTPTTEVVGNGVDENCNGSLLN